MKDTPIYIIKSHTSFQNDVRKKIACYAIRKRNQKSVNVLISIHDSSRSLIQSKYLKLSEIFSVNVSSIHLISLKCP